MEVMKNEIFGPILPVKTYSNFDDTVKYINNNPKALALYYFGENKNEVLQVMDDLLSAKNKFMSDDKSGINYTIHTFSNSSSTDFINNLKMDSMNDVPRIKIKNKVLLIFGGTGSFDSFALRRFLTCLLYTSPSPRDRG